MAGILGGDVVRMGEKGSQEVRLKEAGVGRDFALVLLLLLESWLRLAATDLGV
jgi:hypothetical protein